MAVWGPKLYQDDIAKVVRDYYKDQLHRGKTGEEITRELIEQNKDIILDSDEAAIFWFALADTQWDLGRLEDWVKEQALNYIKNGYDLRRWELEEPREIKIRVKTIEKLEQKLSAPQPQKKKMSQYKLYQCQWKIGDVYAYLLDSDYAKEKDVFGKYLLFQKIGERDWYPGHRIPVVWVKITNGSELPLKEEVFDTLEFVQTSARTFDQITEEFNIDRTGLTVEDFWKRVDELRTELNFDQFGFLPEYRIALPNTSKRAIPSKLIFVGNFQHIQAPENEFIPHNECSIQCFNWKWLDQIMIERYCGYNLNQFKHYQIVKNENELGNC